MKKLARIVCSIMVTMFVLTACGLKIPILTGTNSTQNQPYQITGSFSVTNGFVFEKYFVENAVALVDMHGFVVRDQYWAIPVGSQVLGYLNMDVPKLTGTFQLSLPERPEGVLNDVDNNGRTDKGVQIFAVSYWPNFAGGPFAEGDDQNFGWPGYLASVETDATNQDEVTGGKLVVWAPDGNQSFPKDFGADGKLFTADDPVATIPAGYTIVDLDKKPFAFTQEAEPKLTLYEPKDFALKDYSKLSYTESFDKLFEFVRQHYAFNGYPAIEPKWDALYKEIKLRVQQAQANKDADAFWLALRDFTWAFKDGHVGLSSTDYYNQLFSKATDGGYGFTIRELDDGRVVVIFVLDGSPAAQAGMTVGAEVTEFNGKSIKEAISKVVPWTLPMSSDWDLRYQQARYLLRAPVGTEAKITYTNPGDQPKTVTLKAIAELDSFRRASRYFGVNTTTYLPVEYSILDSGVGYVKVNSYSDDLNLTNRLFKRALDTFQVAKVPGIIIDLRDNGGGNPIGLAAYLTDKEMQLPQGYSFSEKTGQFEKKGVPGRLLPNVEQYRFDNMALLVGPNCASACEDEAYTFSQVPGMIVVGMDPTSGTMADVGDGQISMPDGISMQFPTERFILPDGSLFLQGRGVQPTLRVPVTEATAEATDDIVLKTAEKVVLQPPGAGITPSASPRLMSIEETQTALSSGKQFEQEARKQYTAQDLLQMDRTFPYIISLSESQPLLWVWGWCSKDQATLEENLGKIQVTFTLNGQPMSLDSFAKLDYDSSGKKCRVYVVGVTDWKGGESHAITKVTFTAPINDGTYDYTSGFQIYDYAVYVKP